MRIKEAEIEILVKRYDADLSGEIDFEEFLEMMGGVLLEPDFDPCLE